MRSYPLAAAVRLVLVLAAAVIALNLLVLGIQFQAVAVIVLAGIGYRKLTRFRGSGNAYGSARASGFSDLLAAGLISDDGLLMGDCGHLEPPTRAEGLRALLAPLPAPLACKLFLAAWLGRRWAEDIPIRLPSYVHIGTFAPAGAGKGTSGVIPTLRSHPGSVGVTDPKGENYRLTGEFRRRKFRHKVVRLDPFDVCGPGGGGMNPIALLPPADAKDFLNAVRDLANALVVRTGKEENPYWNNRAEDVICAICCFVAVTQNDPKLRNLASVRRIVANQDALLATISIMRTRCDGVVKEQGDSLSFLQPGTEEFAGVMGTVAQQTAFLDGKAVADCLSRNDFDPRDLRSGRVSVYFVLPPHRLESMASLMRVWITATLGTLSQGEASEANPVLLLIDEAAHLGKLRWLETSLTLLRGYGIRTWLFFQSIGQLREVYGDKAQVILDNLGTQQYFGISSSFESAEAVSKRIGEMTVTVVSEQASRSHSHSTGPSGREPQPGNASTSFSTTVSEHGRPWMTASEILTMPSDKMLLMHRNMHVIPTRLVRYYDSPLFRWGGTGRNRGLGLGGILAAAGVCLAALLLSDVVASPPSPPALPSLRRPAATMAGLGGNADPTPVLRPNRPGPRLTDRHAPAGYPARRPVPRRRRYDPRLPSQSGFLIQIR